MELSRRDALFVLAGGGVAGSAAIHRGLLDDVDDSLSGSELRTLGAVADLLYPSSVEATSEFVETYVVGRQRWDDDYLQGVRGALDALGRTSRRETGRSFPSLGTGLRDDVLRATGADRAHSDPAGTEAQRVRYYLVDELLYAFYASPRGGRLVGNENPTGYPGGTDAYQNVPSSVEANGDE